MKIKEMIKKIDTFNEIAEMIGNEKAELRCTIGYGFSFIVSNEKSFKKQIREEYIPEMAKAILDCAEYEFNKDVVIELTDVWGDVLTEKVRFWAI